MNDEAIKKRYELSRKAYINKQELGKLLMLENQHQLDMVFINLRADILQHLETINKKLETMRFLPTDLVFKFLNNKQLLKQIEKDYSDLMNRRLSK